MILMIYIYINNVEKHLKHYEHYSNTADAEC